MLPAIYALIAAAEGYTGGTLGISIVSSLAIGGGAGYLINRDQVSNLQKSLAESQRELAALKPAEESKEDRVEALEALEVEQGTNINQSSSHNEEVVVASIELARQTIRSQSDDSLSASDRIDELVAANEEQKTIIARLQGQVKSLYSYFSAKQESPQEQTSEERSGYSPSMF